MEMWTNKGKLLGIHGRLGTAYLDETENFLLKLL